MAQTTKERVGGVKGEQLDTEEKPERMRGALATSQTIAIGLAYI